MNEKQKLVNFFRNEGSYLGQFGDSCGWSPAETAIQVMRELLKRDQYPAISQKPHPSLPVTSPQPAQPLLTDEEMEHLCETLVDNALHANTPIEMKGIIETALYHRQLSARRESETIDH